MHTRVLRDRDGEGAGNARPLSPSRTSNREKPYTFRRIHDQVDRELIHNSQQIFSKVYTITIQTYAIVNPRRRKQSIYLLLIDDSYIMDFTSHRL
jgi:hypothetical protein